MAFTNFYLQAGASDLNAGSTTDAAALFTYAAGTFVRATGVFTVASGNPLSDGVAVNDWVSIYTTSGAVAATFVGKCTARDATTITVSTTVVMGLATTVSESAGAATAKVGGAWTSVVALAATGLGTFTVPASTKINIKDNLTVTANRTISMAGSTTAPLWFSGYNTTPGDLDGDLTNGLAKPIWTLNSTVTVTASGTHQLWSGLSVVGNVNGFMWTSSSTIGMYSRCRFENTNAGSALITFYVSAGTASCAYCWFKAPTTATSFGVLHLGQTATLIGCVAEGGGVAGFNITNTSLSTLVQCIGLNNTGSAILSTSGSPRIFNFTAYNPTGDGIKWTGTPGSLSPVVSCLFSNCGGWGINNASGANTNLVFRACNDFYSCASGNENGFGDSPAFFGQTDSSAVVTSATNMTPVAGSNARAHGYPGIVENQTFSSFQDVGAVRHIDPSGGGGHIIGG